jgi:hypothetical protein
MGLRIRILGVWLSVLALGTWAGGPLYQMLVVVPMWSASLPESVYAFFRGTDYHRKIFNFFGPPFMLARNLPLVVALIAGWHLPRHRTPLLVAVACFLGFGVLFTAGFVYPVNAVLFAQAGGGVSAEEVRRMAEQWIFRDRLRFVVGLIAFFAVLYAFRLPLPREQAVRQPGEPRVLADGRTAMFGTFTCGLYHLTASTPTRRAWRSARTSPTIDLRGVRWSDGYTGLVVPHGGVFARL